MIQNESRAGCPIPFPSDPGASSGASSRRKARHRIERSSTKRKISFAVAITVGAATLIPLALPASAQRGEAASGIIWKPCTDTPSIQCGTLTLPVDRRKPAKTFDMAVARHQATNSAERLGVLFINPGGPGASGVNFVSTAMDVFPAKILERFDIVGFDPRGIGASQPIMCGNAAVLEAPRSQAEFQRLTNANLALRQDCRNRNGSLFDHADTLNVVQDMDALRAALGEKKINYYGISYGTLIGQQYAQKYGKHVRSMVLDSNMDHSLTAQDLAATSASAVEDSLKKFARWCEVTPVCALHGRKVLPHWNKLLAAADRGQLLTKEGDSVSEYDVLTEAYSDLADAKWSELAAWLEPLRIGDADRKPSPASPDNRQDGQPDLNGRLAVFCQDWNLPIRNYHDWKTLVDAERAAAPHARYSTEMREALLGCIGWPQHVNNPQRPLRLGHDAPTILLINSHHDSTTGHTWASGVNRQAPQKTRLLTYEGSGHGAYHRSKCTRAAVDAYLLKGKLPQQGATCPAE
ncbi:alpha/beta hydrolase [Streptomyces sp. NBC_01210]|uniref:alpha/beta hydrolase n=1 Tax=Streptomyces sp. NBC_01210 TaxID=2903774 RepID=UPI002E1449AC|nr:alpha/beta hydrolase [Streptomyces sp. NBC_01210]